jgi:hypothetical protein
LVILGILVVVIWVLFYKEWRFVAELISKVDKSAFKSALKRLNKNTMEIEDEGNQGRREFKELIMNHLKQLQANENIKSLENGSKSSETHLNKRRVKKHTAIIDKNSNVHMYSTVSQFPDRNLKTILLVIIIATIFTNTPSIVNYFIMTNFYAKVSQALSSASTINAASSSLYIREALYIQQFLQVKNLNLATANYTQDLYKISKTLEGYLAQSVRIEDQMFLSRYSDLKVCAESASRARGLDTALPDSFLVEICLYSSEIVGEDFNWVNGIHYILNEFSYYGQLVRNGGPDNLTTYLTSERFTRTDIKMFHLTITMRSLAEKYMIKIGELINSANDITNILVALYAVMVIATVTVYRFILVRFSLRSWSNLKNIYFSMNDEIINNMYIKSYFGYDIET